MSVWNALILSGAAAAALTAWGGWRYIVWIASIVAAYILSVLYWDLRLPYPEAFGFLCDAAIVTAICWTALYSRTGASVWEMRVSALFLASMFVNMVYLAHNVLNAGIIPHDVHGAILELINALALGSIGLTAAFDRAGYRDGRAFDPWVHVFGLVRPASQRRDPRA